MEKIHRRIDLFAESYWKSMSPDVSKKFDTPSWVIETIAPASKSLSSIMVVCSGGEVMELEGDMETVIWRAKIATSLNPQATTRVLHAAYDSATSSLFVTLELETEASSASAKKLKNKWANGDPFYEDFFSLNDDKKELLPPPTGIFIADLKQVFYSGSTLGPIVVAPFFTVADVGIPSRVEGLAVDPTLRIIFACDTVTHRIHMWPLISPQRVIFGNSSNSSGSNVTVNGNSSTTGCAINNNNTRPKKKRTILSPRAHGAITLEREFHPFKCATMPSEFVNQKGTMSTSLAVADYDNSRIYIFEVVVQTGSDDVRDDVVQSMTATLVRSIASRGSSPGQVLSPRGIAFDTSGNLIVADYGNSRVQIFSKKLSDKPSRLSMLGENNSFSSPIVSPRTSPRTSPKMGRHIGFRPSVSSQLEGTGVIVLSPLYTGLAVGATHNHGQHHHHPPGTNQTDGLIRQGEEDKIVLPPKMKPVWTSGKIPKLRSVGAAIDPERRQPIIVVGLYNASEVGCYR